jgi:DNA-binding NarL/FixJ family response regulator
VPGILIVDDHPVIRSTVRSLLEAHELPVCGEAADGKAAIEKATDLRPDLVLLDVVMPVMTGLEAAQELRRILPAMKIVFLTMHEAATLEKTIRSCSHGFVQKHVAATELIPLVKDLLALRDGEPQLKYPSWQQIVRDAFAARRESLVSKINFAERTIAARLRQEIDRQERRALREALHALQRLILESGADPKRKGRDKYGAA